MAGDHTGWWITLGIIALIVTPAAVLLVQGWIVSRRNLPTDDDAR